MNSPSANKQLILVASLLIAKMPLHNYPLTCIQSNKLKVRKKYMFQKISQREYRSENTWMKIMDYRKHTTAIEG